MRFVFKILFYSPLVFYIFFYLLTEFINDGIEHTYLDIHLRTSKFR